MYFINLLIFFSYIVSNNAQYSLFVPKDYCKNQVDISVDTKNLEQHDIMRIELGAFDDCPNLENITIKGSLGTIDSQIFRNNKRLKVINLNSAGLFEIHGKMFDGLNDLETLNLGHNNLTNFIIDEFPILPSLQTIDLHNNFLNDLDVTKIPKKFPSLRKLLINNNYIECDIFETINETLSSKNIEILQQVFQLNDNYKVCIPSTKINEIFNDAKLSLIRGRIDNQVLKEDVRQLKEINENLTENVEIIEEKYDQIKGNLEEIVQKTTFYSNQIMSIQSVQEGFVTKHIEYEERTNLMVFFSVGATIVLAIVIAFVIKCFVSMRRELMILRGNNNAKSGQSLRRQ